MNKIFEDLSFVKIGTWEISSDNLIEYKPISGKENNYLVKNSLYMFTCRESEDILYVGKTTQSLKKRLYGYSRGNGVNTNNRIHINIKEKLQSKEPVDIYGFNDTTALNWGKYNINLAAGLEDSIIAVEKPIWNGNNSESYVIEKEADEQNVEQKGRDLLEENTFAYLLGNTYYNHGFVNIPISLSHLLGDHSEGIIVHLERNNIQIDSTINRTANPNGSVRLTTGIAHFRDYFQEHYNLGDYVKISVEGQHRIIIH